MEPEQKELIDSNFESLVDNTICNAVIYSYLIQNQVLFKADTQRLETKRKAEGEIEEAKLFYEIVKTRDNSFDFVVEALEKAKQTGALKFFKPTGTTRSSTDKLEEFVKPTGSTVKAKSAETVIIGKDCKVGTLVDIVEQSSVCHAFLDKLNTLGQKLEVSASSRYEIMDSLRKKIDKLEQLITVWVDNQGERATLNVLLQAIEDCNSIDISERIKKHLNVL